MYFPIVGVPGHAERSRAPLPCRLTQGGPVGRLSETNVYRPGPDERIRRDPSLSHWSQFMPNTHRRREEYLPGAGLLLLLLFLGVSGAGAQELPLKRVLPGSDGFTCPQIDPGRQAGPEEQEQARVLGSNADQSLLLGDQARARDLLARATALDPASPDLAYRYARILEDLDERDQAITEFCRALALGAEDLGFDDARSRLEVLVLSDQPQFSDEARGAFSAGLIQADEGLLDLAADAFGAALRLAPDLAEAVYNRGVIRDRQGDVVGAVADYQSYLARRPEGEDAIAVSQRIGQLQSAGPLPSAGTTLTLGMLIPGMGQFYSGRAAGGLAILGLAAGALATGFLVEEIETFCVGSVTGGGECPPERVISENKNKPYLTQSLVAAGAITVIGAVEAFIKVRRGSTGGDPDPLAFNVGSARVGVPEVYASGPRLNVSLLKVKF